MPREKCFHELNHPGLRGGSPTHQAEARSAGKKVRCTINGLVNGRLVLLDQSQVLVDKVFDLLLQGPPERLSKSARS